ncbi:MAG: histidine kinase [Verrucomicrobiota bacterium]
MLSRCHLRHLTRFTLSALTCLVASRAEAGNIAQITNPIGRIARIFDPQLVKTEDRVSWLENRVASFAEHREHAMKTGLGYRGCRAKAGAPDPSVTLDLGGEYPIETVFLVPAQREFLEDLGIFPKRFTLELSSRADFSERTVIFTSGPGPSPTRLADGNPVPFKVLKNNSARYVRLTVQEGHNRGTLDLFGLSEIAVISNHDPVSFGATVATVGDLNVPGIWNPEALTDGRTPLGIWQNGGRANSESGDLVKVSRADETISWTITLSQAAPLDRLVLFPYQLDRSSESSVFPDSMSVHLQDADGHVEKLACQWTNPLAGASSMNPLVIPLAGKSAKTIRLTGVRPCVIGESKVQALSECEVWSRGKNLAEGLPVTRSHGAQKSVVKSLTDGYASEKQIIPVAVWFEQLYERGRIERELAMLRPVHRQLASESELNATWGSAVVLGLTFLIPVFIVERRRLMSRDQIDQLRKRIASDLHDDIGSNLGSISLIARTARKDLVRLQGPEEVAEDLGEVESIARESSLAMRDIVWLLERRQDSIGDLVQRMRETAGRLLREINYTVECESNKTAAKLSLDAKRHLFLFYKEAIHNVLKHSQANRVSIRLWDEDDKLALEILDNGIGLPVNEEERSPKKVNKLEDRARVLEGSLNITSSKDSGTKIRLLVKRSHLIAHPTLA